MFLANGQLYTGDASGNLYRRGWDAAKGLPTGAATLVSGPAKGDGQDWRARDAFVFAQAGRQAPNMPPTAGFTQTCTAGLCDFTSTSADTDGSIVDWAWNFGDGTAGGIGANPSHVFAETGTYQVTLTVTDNRGGTATATVPVSVVVPNQPPAASISPSCNGLDCTFTSTSRDVDGSIVDWAWTFGDGEVGSGTRVQHTYPAAGAYPVTLSVTDNDGAQSTARSTVTVVDPSAMPTVAFRAANGVDSSSLNPSVGIPSSVQSGDLMVLISSVNSAAAAVNGPAGWTLVESGVDSAADLQTRVWAKAATPGEAGSTASISQSGNYKTSLQLLAYAGATGVSSHQIAFDRTSTNTRTTPAATVTAPGSAVVSYWSDRTTGNTGWNLPGSVTLRNQTVGTGGGHITSAVADMVAVPSGPVDGQTATSSVSSTKSVTATLVIEPEGSPNTPPTATFTPTCNGLSCTFDASASSDNTAIASYAWTLGDGQSATGMKPTHAYASAGTYAVTLTVTDDGGLSNSTTGQVTVSQPAPVQIGFRAAAEAQGNVTVATVQVPASVQAGDTLVAVSTHNSITPTVTGPAGWTLLRSGTDSATTIQTYVWTKIATAAEAGATITVTNSSITKTTLQVVAYSGVGSITAQNLAFDTILGAAHSTPSVPVTVNASTVLSVWTDRTSTNTSWTLPAGVTLRSQVAGTGSAHMTTAIGSTSSVSSGISGGFTATSQEASRRAATWSIVLAPR
jgi:PKD repeat protein